NNAWPQYFGPVAQQFDMRGSADRRKRRYLHAWVSQPIEPRLFRSVIERSRRNPKTEAFIERFAERAVGYADRGMIDAKTEIGRARFPSRRRVAIRKCEEFQRMAVWITEFERGDTTRRFR